MTGVIGSITAFRCSRYLAVARFDRPLLVVVARAVNFLTPARTRDARSDNVRGELVTSSHQLCTELRPERQLTVILWP